MLRFGVILLTSAIAKSSALHAQGLPTVHRLPAALPLEPVGEAVAACERDGLHVSAMVLDTDGVEIASMRGDGSGVQRRISHPTRVRFPLNGIRRRLLDVCRPTPTFLRPARHSEREVGQAFRLAHAPDAGSTKAASAVGNVLFRRTAKSASVTNMGANATSTASN